MPHDEYAAIADLYDHVALHVNRPDIAFYLDAARESGGPVLELGCGSGRVLIPTARAGVSITGVDGSPAMLATARNALAREAPEVQSRAQLVEADMRSFHLGRTFALVTIPFRPFQHLLTVDDQLACLATIRRHLADDGRLILDLFNPSLDLLVHTKIGEEVDEGQPSATPDGRTISRRFKTVAADRFAQVNRFELIYCVTDRDGRQERFVHSFGLRYLFRFEAEHLLARAGFRVERLYGGFDRSEYGTSYPGELIFTARKA